MSTVMCLLFKGPQSQGISGVNMSQGIPTCWERGRKRLEQKLLEALRRFAAVLVNSAPN